MLIFNAMMMNLATKCYYEDLASEWLLLSAYWATLLLFHDENVKQQSLTRSRGNIKHKYLFPITKSS